MKQMDVSNEFGMTLIKTEQLPVESLQFNRKYQRDIEHKRKENIKKSIRKCGCFLPDQTIIVNQIN